MERVINSPSYEVLGSSPRALIAALEEFLSEEQLLSCNLVFGENSLNVNTIQVRQGSRMDGSTYNFIWIGHEEK